MVNDLVYPRDHNLFEQLNHLLGRLLRALEQKLVAAGDYGLGLQGLFCGLCGFCGNVPGRRKFRSKSLRLSAFGEELLGETQHEDCDVITRAAVLEIKSSILYSAGDGRGI
jgi:hypothetical protein